MKKIVFLTAILGSVSNISIASQEFPTLMATDTTLNNKPAFSIVFGHQSDDAYKLSIQCETIKHSNKGRVFTFEPYSAASLTYNKAPDILGWSDSKFDTYLKINFLEKDFKKNKVVISLSAKLLNVRAENTEFLNTDELLLNFTSSDIAELKKACKIK